MNNTMGENDDKHIMISERYSIEQDSEDSKGRKPKIEESKDEKSSKEQNKDVHIGLRNYYLDDLMVKRPNITPENKNEQSVKTFKNTNLRQPSRDSNGLSKIRKDNNQRITSCVSDAL